MSGGSRRRHAFCLCEEKLLALQAIQFFSLSSCNWVTAFTRSPAVTRTRPRIEDASPPINANSRLCFLSNVVTRSSDPTNCSITIRPRNVALSQKLLLSSGIFEFDTHLNLLGTVWPNRQDFRLTRLRSRLKRA